VCKQEWKRPTPLRRRLSLLDKSYPKISARTTDKVASGRISFSGKRKSTKKNDITFSLVNAATDQLGTDAATSRVARCLTENMASACPIYGKFLANFFENGNTFGNMDFSLQMAIFWQY